MKDPLSSLYNTSIWPLTLFNSTACELSATDFISCNFLSSSFSFLISPVYIDRFWTTSTRYSVPSLVPVVDVVAEVETLVVGIVVRGTISIGVWAMLTASYFSFTNFSICSSICLIYRFCSMISFIMSNYWVSVSWISLANGSSEASNFSCFFNVATSEFFFLMRSYAAFMFEGSYPIFSTRFSKDLILVSFVNEDTFSNFSCDWVLAKATCIFDKLMVVFVKVEEIICPVCLCISIWSIGCTYFTLNSKEVCFGIEQ